MTSINLDQSATVSSIYNIIHENTNTVLDKFIEFITNKVEIEEIDDYVNEFKELYKNTNNLKLKKKKKDVKGETNPSVYNHFIKYKISTMEKKSGGEKGSYMTAAGDLWKSTNEGKYYKRRAKDIKQENLDILNKDVFDIIKKEWDTNDLVNEEIETDCNASCSKDEEDIIDVKSKTNTKKVKKNKD
jgi:hypothetical protein